MAMMLGDYLILTQCGAGPDGLSYRARCRTDGRLVEVRVLEEARKSKERWPVLAKRVRAAALIEHPAVVRVVEFVEDAERPFVILDWCDAQPLGVSYRDRVPLAESEAIALA